MSGNDSETDSESELTMGIMQMAEQALTEIDTMTCEEAVERKDDEGLVFVDVRDIREVEQSDTI